MPRIDQHEPYGAWPGFPGEQVCGPTAAYMLGRYFGSPVLDSCMTPAQQINSLWEKFGMAGENGTAPDEMSAMLGSLGLRFAKDAQGAEYQPGLVKDGSGGYTVNSTWMSQQLLAGRPVLVQGSIDGDTGHWLIVTDVKGSPPVYTVNNPYDSSQATMTQDEMREFLANAAGGGHLYAIEQDPNWRR